VVGGPDSSSNSIRASALTTAVLDEEALRQAEQARAGEPILFADELLPGVGSDDMSLREGLRAGGMMTFGVLLVLNLLDEFATGALTVLGPDIQKHFELSDGQFAMFGLAVLSGIMLGLGPWGYLADRMRRGPLIAVATMIFAVFSVLIGLSVSAFMMFFMLFFASVGKANTQSAHSSLIADTYPIAVRGRVLSTTSLAARAMQGVAPVVVGLAAAAATWRLPYLLMGIPVGIAALAALRLPEPVRGQWEKDDVLGQVLADENPAPISFEAASARLWKIATFRGVIIAFAAMGFGLFVAPVYMGLFLEEQYGLEAAERGYVLAAMSFPVIAVLPFVGRTFDRTYRSDPQRAIALLGLVLLPVGILIPFQYSQGTPTGFVLFGMVSSTLMAVAFSLVGPIIQTVVPFRLRGQGTAVAALFIFLIGGVGGFAMAGMLVDGLGEGRTIIVLMTPSMLIGAAYVLATARHIRRDLSLVVSELQEELAESERQAADPDQIPALQVNEIDFSYGPVQVLFDVAFEVRKGEVLALLGTNGAGKSTILKVISGLVTPERGVVRLGGRTITYTSPEDRTRLGIHMLVGGHGAFSSMTVRQNLVMGAYQYRKDPADVDRRIDRVFELFPTLRDRQDVKAEQLSGGQQQMLALARTLQHDPEVLIIDELSLGLAPLVVTELLGIVEDLKQQGITMIIVEQSLNVALSIADRAVFLEKGRVRFEGLASELRGRDDLARAVFLGAEGG